MDKECVARLMGSIVGEENIRIDEPMKNHTSFKVGGPADVMVMPNTVQKLVSVYKTCREKDIPVFVVGNGTNLLVKDGGIRGVVIKIAENLSSYEVSDGIIRAQAGAPISEISRFALENGLSGIEFAEGIPGTLGGAIAMNAGAYNGEIADVALRTEYLDADGKVKVLKEKEHMFGKRTSFIQEHGGVVIASELKLKEGAKEEIRARMDEFNRQRKEKQPLDMPSAGSIFKRPDGFFAGKLIEDCGLKGFGIGGAKVSSKHCGFIINSGGATAEDILRLIRHIQENVWLKFGVELQTEVKIIGDE